MSCKNIDKIIKEIDDGLVKFIKDGKYKEVLMSISNLNKYSLNNQLYILTQFPNAKTVYGIKGWNKLERHVKKSEHAIKIFCPIIKKDIEENEKKEKIVGYRSKNVFDISQTEGKELDVFRFDQNIVIENKYEIEKSIIEYAKTIGFSVLFIDADTIEEDVYGLCDKTRKIIKVRNDLASLQEVSTLIHECAHACAHSIYRPDFEGLTIKEKREIKEVEAESIACIVCDYLGLDTKNFNFSYITAWASGDIRKFRHNLEQIKYYATKIIEGIENNLTDEKNIYQTI